MIKELTCLYITIFFCCLFSSVLAAGIDNDTVSIINGNTPGIYSVQNHTSLKNFVLAARDYALANGKEKALATFNDRGGPFVKGELYIFAVDYEGYSLALPYEPENIRSNRLLTMDQNGFRYAIEGRDIARRGGGFQSYIYANPNNNFQPALKLSYITDVDGSYYIGAGIYSNNSLVKPKTVNYTDIKGILDRVVRNTTSHLTDIEDNLEQAAGALSSTDLTGPKAEEIERRLCESDPNSFVCLAIAANGTIMSVQPTEFSTMVGKNILDQGHIGGMIDAKNPGMSNQIQTIEGIGVIDFMYPIFDNNGNLIGGTSLILRHEPFFSGIFNATNSTNMQATITQKDGKIIFDVDPGKIGKYSLSDPMFSDFPSLKRLHDREFMEKQGAETYTFVRAATPDPANPDSEKDDIVNKAIVWNTTGQFGNYWKIFIDKVI